MKKSRLIILVSAILLIGAGAGFAYFKMKKSSGGKKPLPTNAMADVKIESKTMPEIYKEMVDKSPLFTYERNNEIIPVLEKALAADPGNQQLKFSLGLQNLYNGTTQKAIDIFLALENRQVVYGKRKKYKTPGQKMVKGRFSAKLPRTILPALRRTTKLPG